MPARARPAGVPAALRDNLTCVREPEHAIDVEVVLVRGSPRELLFSEPGGVDTVQVWSDDGQVRSLREVAGG